MQDLTQYLFPSFVRRGEGEVEAPSSTQVVSGDLSSFRHQIETKQNRKEHPLHIQHGPGHEKQVREEDPWSPTQADIKDIVLEDLTLNRV